MNDRAISYAEIVTMGTINASKVTLLLTVSYGLVKLITRALNR